MNKVLITGAAGFIGSQLSRRLMDRGLTVKGLDNFNEHLYTPRLTRDRMVHFDLDIWGCDLKDEIKVEALKKTEKLEITKNYILPEILKTVGYNKSDIETI